MSRKISLSKKVSSEDLETNLKVRQEKDWEKKEGRSVSFKKTN